MQSPTTAGALGASAGVPSSLNVPPAVPPTVAAGIPECPSISAAVAPGSIAHPRTVTPRPAGRVAPIQAVVEDPLMHEAALVAEARGSLMRGDAIGALRTIRAAGALSPRALEPEELSIESRALRVLGRDAEAAQVDVELRSRYPEHALSR
jgi:hypothetical protein